MRAHLRHCEPWIEHKAGRDQDDDQDQLGGYAVAAQPTPEEIAELAADIIIQRMHPHVVYRCASCGLAVVRPWSERNHDHPCRACTEVAGIAFRDWFEAGAWNAVGRTSAPATEQLTTVKEIPNFVPTTTRSSQSSD